MLSFPSAHLILAFTHGKLLPNDVIRGVALADDAFEIGEPQIIIEDAMTSVIAVVNSDSALYGLLSPSNILITSKRG